MNFGTMVLLILDHAVDIFDKLKSALKQLL